MYKINVYKQNNCTVLRSKKWRVTLMNRNGHIYAVALGPNRYRKQGITSIKSELNVFELKVVALYLYRHFRESFDGLAERQSLDNINYAQVFGSFFD